MRWNLFGNVAFGAAHFSLGSSSLCAVVTWQTWQTACKQNSARVLGFGAVRQRQNVRSYAWTNIESKMENQIESITSSRRSFRRNFCRAGFGGNKVINWCIRIASTFPRISFWSFFTLRSSSRLRTRLRFCGCNKAQIQSVFSRQILKNRVY